MKTIFRIAKTELSTLFYSPVAWLILVIFAFQTGMAFSDIFGQQLLSQALGDGLWSVTSSIYTGYFGVFTGMLKNLYLYIPLLTMGLMSREYSSGSIKLLYSSPVTNRQIVWGKYLSMMIYNLLLIGILVLTVLLCMATVKEMNIGLVMSGLLGIYLVICTYAAIGLFMSTLTSYQVVAAMGTLAVLAVLNYIGDVGQDIQFVREITYWLSISGRSHQFIEGMICSEDVIYFLVVIGLFISLSILKLQSERQKRFWVKTWSRYAGVVALALLIGFGSSRPKLIYYYDSTTTKVNTLTEASQEIMKKLDGGLKITTYVNMLDHNYTSAVPSQMKFDFERFIRYIRFKPEIEMEYVYYYDKTENPSLDERFPGLSDKEKAEKLCKILEMDFKMLLSPEEIKRVIDLSGEGNHFVRVLERENGQKSFLRLYDDNQKHPSEMEISAALKRFIVKSPRVAFLTGHDERDIEKTGDRDYNHFAESIYFRYSLINQGFDVIRLNLSDENIPEDIDIIVVADMKTALSAEEEQKLDHYIGRGGNLFILGDTRRQEVMNPLVEKFGVRFMLGTLVQQSEEYIPSLIVGNITEEAAEKFPTYFFPYNYGYKITMPEAVALDFNADKGFEMCPVIRTKDQGCWNELETTDFLDGQVVLNESVGEVEKSWPTVMALSRKVGDKEQRIVVSGDADCISNGELDKARNGIGASNFTLITGTFKWLSYGEYPLDTERPTSPDNEVYLGRSVRSWIKFAYMGAVPFLLALAGIAIWVRRKGR